MKDIRCDKRWYHMLNWDEMDFTWNHTEEFHIPQWMKDELVLLGFRTKK